MKYMLGQWISEKRYKELISCAHGGWYQDSVIFEPLAEHFVENKLFDVQLLRADMIAVPSSFSEDEAIRSIRAAYKCASIHLESKGIDLLAICIRKITETPSSLEKAKRIVEDVLENTNQMGMEPLHPDDDTDI